MSEKLNSYSETASFSLSKMYLVPVYRKNFSSFKVSSFKKKILSLMVDKIFSWTNLTVFLMVSDPGAHLI